jgi:hypothetical protein
MRPEARLLQRSDGSAKCTAKSLCSARLSWQGLRYDPRLRASLQKCHGRYAELFNHALSVLRPRRSIMAISGPQ